LASGDPPTSTSIDRAEILDYVETWAAGKRFEPPVSLSVLAKSFRAGVHHSSAIYFKRNVLSATFIPHQLLTREEFDKWSLDFLVFGNGQPLLLSAFVGQIHM
jgi:capsid portal protein